MPGCLLGHRLGTSHPLGHRTDSQLPLSAIQSILTAGCVVLEFYRIDTHNGQFARSGDTMMNRPYAVRRANPRFSFFADAEVTLRDGTGVRAQLAELSSRGCYIDTLEPIPTRTSVRLRIYDGMRTCELDGKV